MGLMEQLIEAIGKLNTRLDALENGQQMKPNAVLGESNELLSGTGETSSPTGAVTTVELDKNGIPWDERIHAGTKRKNADGTWSMKKGVDKDLYSEIMAQYQAAPNYSESPDMTPVVEQKPAPTPPGKPAPTKPAPTPPGKPVPPQKPEAAGDTTKAARAANTLVNDFKVDYDDIIETLLKPLGVDAFGSLTIEQATEVLKGLEAWVKSLTDLKEEFDGITKMAEGTEHVDAIAEGLTDFVSTHGGKDGVVGSVPYANLHPLLMEVAEWANQWEEFFKG